MNLDKNFDRWIRWTARGNEVAITELLDVLDSNLPPGWQPLVGDQMMPYSYLGLPGSRWYGLEPTPDAVGVVLCVQRSWPSNLQGGRVSFPVFGAIPRKPGDPVSWDRVGRFLDEGIVPAARTSGVTVEIPTPQEVFLRDLPFDVRDRLESFSDGANKKLPLNLEQAEPWHDFVIAVFRAKAVLDLSSLNDWLVTAGWSSEAADELSLRFIDQCLLLDRYRDEVSAARL